MSLTPMDIHNKEFTRKFRGYHEDEVDQFLDKIVDDYERLYKENIELKDKVNALGDQINQYKTMESTLKETLVTAQKTADEVTALARKKAELILKEAEEQARHVVESANDHVVEIRREFRSLLETQMELVSGDAAASEDRPPEENEE